ncbi:MAG TPA: hypothetical protein VM534_07465, partial [Thermoanaerobaculia bacterium]|nr:hypothetical protein [Thermoanaerobaculia bacterium]
FLEGKRQANSCDIGEYVARLSRGDGAIVFEEVLDATMERRERLLLGLRQIEGMTADDFRSLTGDEGEAWKREGLDDGWLRPGAGRIAFTPRGLLLSNELLARLF